jgi:hypothetical protein
LSNHIQSLVSKVGERMTIKRSQLSNSSQSYDGKTPEWKVCVCVYQTVVAANASVSHRHTDTREPLHTSSEVRYNRKLMRTLDFHRNGRIAWRFTDGCTRWLGHSIQGLLNNTVESRDEEILGVMGQTWKRHKNGPGFSPAQSLLLSERRAVLGFDLYENVNAAAAVSLLTICTAFTYI